MEGAWQHKMVGGTGIPKEFLPFWNENPVLQEG